MPAAVRLDTLQPAVDILQVDAHVSFGYSEPPSDLGIGVAGSNLTQQFPLPRVCCGAAGTGGRQAPRAHHRDQCPDNYRHIYPTVAPQRQAIGGPREVYLHFHGVSAEDAATILAGRNRPDGSRV